MSKDTTLHHLLESLGVLRSDSTMEVQEWLNAHEERAGGYLVLHASTAERRPDDLPEALYVPAKFGIYPRPGRSAR
jgi:hypothetical protein